MSAVTYAQGLAMGLLFGIAVGSLLAIRGPWWASLAAILVVGVAGAFVMDWP